MGQGRRSRSCNVSFSDILHGCRGLSEPDHDGLWPRRDAASRVCAAILDEGDRPGYNPAVNDRSPAAGLAKPSLQVVEDKALPGEPAAPAPAPPRRRDWLRWARRRPLGFVRGVVRRFIADNCLGGASALSYATVVSLIPLAAILLALFSAFQVFEGARDRFLIVLLQMFAPEVGEEIASSLQQLAGNAANTTTLGIIALAATAIILMVTIEEHLNVIWRIKQPRRWIDRILIYWTILTLGPLLVGAAVSVTSYLNRFAQAGGPRLQALDVMAGEALAALSWIIPFILEAGAFLVLYRLVPNCRVRWRDGVAGALVAAMLLEGLKLAMVVYVTRFASYSTVYGALAGIPIFLLWLYVFWVAVLFGAEVAAHLSGRAGIGRGGASGEPRP
jgi:membrane protein